MWINCDHNLKKVFFQGTFATLTAEIKIKKLSPASKNPNTSEVDDEQIHKLQTLKTYQAAPFPVSLPSFFSRSYMPCSQISKLQRRYTFTVLTLQFLCSRCKALNAGFIGFI